MLDLNSQLRKEVSLGIQHLESELNHAVDYFCLEICPKKIEIDKRLIFLDELINSEHLFRKFW